MPESIQFSDSPFHPVFAPPPFARRASGVATFTIPGISGVRIAFSEDETSGQDSREAEHILHWPVSILE